MGSNMIILAEVVAVTARDGGSSRRSKIGQLAVAQIANVFDAHIGGRVDRDVGRCYGVMALAYEDRRQLVTERKLHRCQQLWLVVDHHVMRCGMALLHGCVPE